MTTCEAEVFRRADGLFDWRLYAENGEQMCESSQGYTEANDAREGFVRVVDALTARLVQLGGATWKRTDPPTVARAMIREGVADG